MTSHASLPEAVAAPDEGARDRAGPRDAAGAAQPAPAARVRQSARVRPVALWLHRYVGLLLAVFLVVAGLTGSLIAFFEELDAALAPELYAVSQPEEARAVAASEYAGLARQLPPGTAIRWVELRVEANRPATAWTVDGEGRWRQWFIDPPTGAVLGSRSWATASADRAGLMPLVYRLHYSLALDVVGAALFGAVAVLWTLDCFVGAYLTFPQGTGSARARPTRGWLTRFRPAWLVRGTQLFGLVFTWHRASGLWLWGVLLVFAWSAVGLNLPMVYRPTMALLVGLQPAGHELLPELSPPFPEPELSLAEAETRGRALMAQVARERGLTVLREHALYYAADHGAYGYVVESSADISSHEPETEVYFDGRSGALLGASQPTGVAFGNTLSTWLLHLHRGSVLGVWYRAFVAVFGVLVAVLSVTGVWIWWRKRARRLRAATPAPDARSSQGG